MTYVRIYEATPNYVYVGYTPGYMGTVVSPYGTVVYGTGYVYSPWIGSVWYPAPYTYGLAVAPIYNPYVGFTFGFALGLATAAWYPYWGGAYYHPGYWGAYPCCATAAANVYGHWGAAAYSGTRSWYAGGGVAGSTFRGSYYNQRTGTFGNVNAGRQYNAWTGNASRGYDRTAYGAAGGYGAAARGSNYNVYTDSGRLRPASRASVPAAAPISVPAQRRPVLQVMRTPARVRCTTRRLARPTPGTARASATITTPTSTATSITTTAAAGISNRPAVGQKRRETRRGPTALRRRAPLVKIVWAASPGRTTVLEAAVSAVVVALVEAGSAAVFWWRRLRRAFRRVPPLTHGAQSC